MKSTRKNIIYRGNSIISIENLPEYAHPVIVKKPAQKHPSERHIRSLEKEDEMTRVFDKIRGVRKVLDIRSIKNLPVLILENIDGQTLLEYRLLSAWPAFLVKSIKKISFIWISIAVIYSSDLKNGQFILSILVPRIKLIVAAFKRSDPISCWASCHTSLRNKPEGSTVRWMNVQISIPLGWCFMN
jgi:hypothetical protein